MKVIGLSAKAGAGKTTLANLLVDKIPGAVRWSFADGVREEVGNLLGLPARFVQSPEFKRLDHRIGVRIMSGREVLQWWGTDIRRAADPDYWLDQMEKRLSRADVVGGPSVVIIDDVRFESEARMCLLYGALFRINPFSGWEPGVGAAHQSEVELDGFGEFTDVFSPEHGKLDEVARRIMGWLSLR